MKNNRDEIEEEVEENPDDYCFVCKGGGDLILCDYQNCTKCYHLQCAGLDESFLEKKNITWKCKWHTCFICHEAADFGCFLCPQAQCRRCINKANFVLLRKKKGFCVNCLKHAILVVEDRDVNSDGEEVDYEDLQSFEGLFKDMWPIFNKKEGFTAKDLRDADNRLKNELNYDSRADTDNDEGDQETQNRDHKRTFKKSNKEDIFTVKDLQDADVQFEKELNYYPRADFDNESKNKKKKTRDHKRKRISKKSNEKEIPANDHQNYDVQLEGGLNYYPRQDSDYDADDQEKGNRGHKRKKISKKSNEKEFPTLNELQLDLVYADIVEENMKLVYLRQGLLEQYEYRIKLKKFAEEKEDTNKSLLERGIEEEVLEIEKKVLGSFVRVSSDLKKGTEKIYQLMRVTGINSSMSAENNGDILLQVSDMPNDISISMLSDADISKEECNDLMRRIKEGLLERLTIEELTQKAVDLHEDITNYWIERELYMLKARIEFANEKGRRRELCECLEKKRRLEDPAEKSRLRSRVPKVIPDISDSIQITNNLEDDDGDDDDDDEDEHEKEEKRSPKPVLDSTSSKNLVDRLEASQTSVDPKKPDEDEVIGHRSAEKPLKKRRILNKTDEEKLKSPNKNKKDKLNSPQRFFADIILENIKLVYLRSSLLEEYLAQENDEFDKKVIGSFVRVRSHRKRDSHRLVEVTGIKKSLPGNKNSNILLQVSDSPNDVCISMLSDADFSEEECNELKQKIKDGLHKKLSLDELESKAIMLHEDITKNWIALELASLQNRIDRANEKGWRKELNACVAKKEVLETSGERSRLLNKVPVVIPDIFDLEPIQQTSSPKPILVTDSPESLIHNPQQGIPDMFESEPIQQASSPKPILVTDSPENLIHNPQGNKSCSGDDAGDRDENEQATSAKNAAKVTKDDSNGDEGTINVKQDYGDTQKHEPKKKRGRPRKACPRPVIVSSF